MKHLEELKDSMKMELEKYGKQGLNSSNFGRIKELLSAYKDACKIEMLEEEAEGGYSEARGGRGGNRGGRSSYDGGSSYRGGQGGSSYEGGYSQAKDDMMMMLGEMMEDASPKEREALKKCMRELERD